MMASDLVELVETSGRIMPGATRRRAPGDGKPRELREPEQVTAHGELVNAFLRLGLTAAEAEEAAGGRQ
jgi:hypothetical protein